MHDLYLMDYHLHTAVTIDGRMDEYSACEKALSMGIHEIAFTNHVGLTQPEYSMSPVSLVDHLEKIRSCELRFPQLKIRLGLEMDYYPDRETEIAAKLDNYQGLIDRPFDLILGSIHEINGSFYSNTLQAESFFKDRDLLALYREHFDLSTQAAQSRLFDIIAHPDLIKKYTHQLTPPVPFDSYRSSVEPFIDALIKNGIGIEVNTKGLKLPVQEAYPSTEFLKLYLARIRSSAVDPIITIGSDAHKVDDVGFGILEMTEVLQNLGVSYLTSFEKRNKSAIGI